MAQFGEELAFLKTQALALQNIAVAYPNDYQPALEDVPRKVLPFQVRVHSWPEFISLSLRTFCEGLVSARLRLDP